MNIEIEVFNTEVKVKNFVGIALIEQFAQRFPDNKAYVLTKSDEIKDLDVVSCLTYWFSLDCEGRQIFANKLRVPLEVVSETAKGLKQILNGGF